MRQTTLPRGPRPDAVLLIGPLELEVPIRVETRYIPAYNGGWDEPSHGEAMEFIDFERLDGLPVHDGIIAAVDLWWGDEGEAECLARFNDAAEAAREDAADRWRDERLLDRR